MPEKHCCARKGDGTKNRTVRRISVSRTRGLSFAILRSTDEKEGVEPESRISAIAHVIQLAIAPVFLISGVATLLSVLANRLGRIVDRARQLESKLDAADQTARRQALEELMRLSRRARLVNLAITFGTVCALLICIMIVMLFTGTFTTVNLSRLVAVLFIAAMLSLFLALMAFLREVITATRGLRIAAPPAKPGKAPQHRPIPFVED